MIASGVLFYAISTRRFLFLLRNNTRTKDTWGMPGRKTLFGGKHYNWINERTQRRTWSISRNYQTCAS